METIEKKLTDSQILKQLVAGLKTLKPEEFNYSHFVKSYIYDENDNICGTVCCAWGWIHKFVPETGVKIINNGEYKHRISETPYRILKIDINLIDFMFYGFNLKSNQHKYDNNEYVLLFGFNSNIKLEQVINRINYVINRI